MGSSNLKIFKISSRGNDINSINLVKMNNLLILFYPHIVKSMNNEIQVLVKSLTKNVEVVFGYWYFVLPIYDALFKQNSIKHVLTRFTQLKVMQGLQVKLE